MINKENYLQFKQKYPLDTVAASLARDKAFDEFLLSGFPSKKDEAWKYTSLTYLKDVNVKINLDEPLLNHEDMKWISHQLNSDFVNIVFVNGVFNRTLSDDVDHFLQILDMTAADFNSDKMPTEIKMIQLSNVMAFHKSYIEINKNNYQKNEIIQITYFQTEKQSILISPVVKIKIADNVKAKIILNYVSRPEFNQNTSHVLNSDLHIEINKNAELEFLQIQNENLNDVHISRLKFDLNEGSKLVSLDLSLGSKLSRHYLETNFNSENATAGIYGVIALADKQHSDQYTFINHVKGHNQSIQKYKSILADQSNSVFRGRVRIEQDAQKAQSQQLNKSLMLSPLATVNSIPQLEIYADDVKAGHGSTVGQLNKDEMFYFLSRGIDQITATKMLAFGFILEMTSVFQDLALQNKVSEILNEKLNGMMK